MLRMQVIDVRISVSSPTEAFAAAFGRFVNTAEHRLPHATEIALDVRHDEEAYILPSGRREISSEFAAQLVWSGVEQSLREALSSWLHVWGLCIDSGMGRSLIIGEDPSFLRALALHALADGIDVASATGVCIRRGVAVPYALPFHVNATDLARFEAITGCSGWGKIWRDEMGQVSTTVAPPDFGLPWQIVPRPVDDVLVLEWNDGGWSGIGTRRHPSAELERIAKTSFLPPHLTADAKFALLGELRSLAASALVRKLHLGHLARFAPLMRENHSARPERE